MTTTDTSSAIVPMTEKQKFFFDLRGWILLPAVLTPDQIEPLKAEVYDALDELARSGDDDALEGL